MTRKIIVVLITLFISASSFAQINSTSVYSFFGIGDRNNSATTEQLSMGGVGVTLSEPHRINLSNPAAKPTGFLNFNPKTSRSKRLSFTSYIDFRILGTKGILQINLIKLKEK